MTYTRKYQRYPTHREARFSFEDTTENGQMCTIVNVSRKGMGIIFHTDEEMSVGTILRVEVPLTKTSAKIRVAGTLRWLDRMEVDMIGGIELTDELCDEELSRLDTSSPNITTTQQKSL